MAGRSLDKGFSSPPGSIDIVAVGKMLTEIAKRDPELAKSFAIAVRADLQRAIGKVGSFEINDEVDAIPGLQYLNSLAEQVQSTC